MHFSKRFIPFLLALAFACAAPLRAQGPIALEDIVGSAGQRTLSIQVSGQPATLVAQATRLVDLHGAFRRVNSQADFGFDFQPAGANGVALTIRSGGKTLWQGTFTGSTQLDALYAAGDAAVQKTLGQPGFFQTRIAFISDRTGHSELHLADILFQSVRQLTRDASQCLSPELSPDGQTILYTSYHGTGFPDIYRIDLASGRRTTFAGFKGTNSGANFSPDGRQVAMVLSSSGNSEIYVSNADGRQMRRLTRTSSLEADPTWSPDSTRLAFTSDQMGGPQIYVTDAQGRSMRRVQTDISRNCSEPDWNPADADRIAFTAASGGEFEVAVYSFKEGRSQILTRGPGDAVHPAWLNDGRHLVYTERTSRSRRLMVLDTFTGKRTVLSPAGMGNAQEASAVYFGR